MIFENSIMDKKETLLESKTSNRVIIKKINLNLVVIYYTQINLFLCIQFPVTVADVDIMVEMGGVEPPS